MMGIFSAKTSGVGEGAGDGVGLAVTVEVEVAMGEGWKKVGVGVGVGESRLPQDVHRIRRQMIAAPAERDRGRLLFRDGLGIRPAESRADGRAEGREKSELEGEFRSIGKIETQKDYT